MAEDNVGTPRPQLKVRRISLDTGRENVVVMSHHSHALRPDIFRGFSRVELRSGSKVVLATLLITDDEALVGPDEIGLSEPAFQRFAEFPGSLVTVSPAVSPASLEAVRAKIQDRTLQPVEIEAIIGDLAHCRYSDMEIAATMLWQGDPLSRQRTRSLGQIQSRGLHTLPIFVAGGICFGRLIRIVMAGYLSPRRCDMARLMMRNP